MIPLLTSVPRHLVPGQRLDETMRARLTAIRETERAAAQAAEDEDDHPVASLIRLQMGGAARPDFADEHRWVIHALARGQDWIPLAPEGRTREEVGWLGRTTRSLEVLASLEDQEPVLHAVRVDLGGQLKDIAQYACAGFVRDTVISFGQCISFSDLLPGPAGEGMVLRRVFCDLESGALILLRHT